MSSTHLRPRVMGIVNVTPDSFSDGGRFLDHASALAQARRLIADGADILDIGGESTRPGAGPVSEADEIARVVPLIAAIRAESGVAISIDTMKPAVARAAVAAGATIWNDVAALRFTPDAPEVAAELGCEVVLMHMLGAPGTMQDDPRYDDVVAEVEAFLLARALTAMAAGVARERIWLDPGIGFGKTPAHNLALLAALPRFVALGHPVLLGASRKRFIAALDPLGAEAGERLGGSLAAHLHGAAAGVAAVRAHDVRETVQALTVWGAIGGRALSDGQIVEVLRAARSDKTPAEVLETLIALSAQNRLEQFDLIKHFKAAFPEIPLRVLIEASTSRLVVGPEGIDDSELNALFGPWWRSSGRFET